MELWDLVNHSRCCCHRVETVRPDGKRDYQLQGGCCLINLFMPNSGSSSRMNRTGRGVNDASQMGLQTRMLPPECPHRIPSDTDSLPQPAVRWGCRHACCLLNALTASPVTLTACPSPPGSRQHCWVSSPPPIFIPILFFSPLRGSFPWYPPKSR